MLALIRNDLKIVSKLLYTIIVLLVLNICCYAEDDYSDFEKNTGFVIEVNDVSYECDDAKDYKIYTCDMNGIVVYVDSDTNPRYVFIDYSGNVTEYEEYGFHSPYKVFKNGLARIELENGKCGYINQDYQWVIPPIYSKYTQDFSGQTGDFSNGYAIACFDDNMYLINNDGVLCMSLDEILHSTTTTNSNPNTEELFSNGYTAYIKNNIAYYLDENLKSIKTNVGNTLNHEYGHYIFGGGTLIYSYGEWRGEEYYVGYRILNHEGKVSYEYVLNVPRKDVYSTTQFVKILPSGVVLFEEPEDFENFESEAKHISVSISGEILGETMQIDNVCSNLFVRGIDDKVINWPNIYDLSLNKIGEITWTTKRDYVFYSSDGDVFGDIIVSKDKDSSAKIEKIRLIKGRDTQLNREGKVVDPAKVPEFNPDENDEVSICINNRQIDFDISPIEENDRILVPMRRIIEELGAEVTWDNDTNTAIAVKNGIEIRIPIDSSIMFKNGEEIKIDAPARLINDGYTFVPLRAVSEAFGCKVEWDEKLKRVDIFTKQ